MVIRKSLLCFSLLVAAAHATDNAPFAQEDDGVVTQVSVFSGDASHQAEAAHEVPSQRHTTAVDMTAFADDLLKERNDTILCLFRDSVKSHFGWLKAGHWIYASEKLLQAGATIAAGYAGFAHDQNPVIASAVMGTSALALAGLGLYALSESSNRLARANSILSALHLPLIPASSNSQSTTTPAPGEQLATSFRR